jgi:hypothetical protein
MLKKSYRKFIFLIIFIIGCGYSYEKFPDIYKKGDTISFTINWITYPKEPKEYDIASKEELVAIAETNEHIFVRVLFSQKQIDTMLKNFPWNTMEINKHAETERYINKLSPAE